MTEKPAVLFLCVHNAGRSQMAAGWLRNLAGDAVDVYSGGSSPGASTNPGAIEAMAEVGIESPASSPGPGLTTTCGPPTWSSPWAAATRALSSPVSATRTGS